MLQITRINLHHKSKLLIRICEHVFFYWKRHITKTILVLILKYLAQQTNTYSNSAVETLRTNSRDCASLLITYNMSKTLFKCFRCAMNMPLFTAMFLLLRFLFQCIYCQFWTDFTPYLLLCVISFVLSPEEATRCSLKKGVL